MEDDIWVLRVDVREVTCTALYHAIKAAIRSNISCQKRKDARSLRVEAARAEPQFPGAAVRLAQLPHLAVT